MSFKSLLLNVSFFILASFLSLTAQPDIKIMKLYVGNYTESKEQGIDIYNFSNKNGLLNFQETTQNVSNPSYISVSPNGKYLYTANEITEYNGKSGGTISAFKIESERGSLNFINQIPSEGSAPCYVTVSNDSRFVLASNYLNQTVASFEVNKNGGLSRVVSVIKHSGSGPNKKRQDASYMHSINLSPDNRYAFAADLGSDRLYVYNFNNQSGELHFSPKQSAVLTAGAGPRHFSINTAGNIIYIVNELNNSIEVFSFNSGNFSKLQTIGTLPNDFQGVSYCADIHLHPNGKYLYASNRGHNSIAIFEIDSNSGRLLFKTTEPVRGDWPRNFVIDPDGTYLLVANQKSKNISTFKINRETGLLNFLSETKTKARPVCLKFLYSQNLNIR